MADTYVVERTETIAAPPGDVFAKVVDLREWDNWSPWAELDADMVNTYGGEPGTVGSSSQWTGNRKVGEGKMQVTEIDEPNRVAIDLEFIKPFKSQSVTEMTVTPDGDGSVITWRMTGQHNWMSKIMGIFKSMDKMVGPDFEKGLAKLKKITES